MANLTPVDDLERDLAALAGRTAWPPTPDLTDGTIRRIAGPRPRRTRFPVPFRTRRLALTAAAITLLLLTSLALFPSAREALAGFLGVPGIHVEIGEETVPPSASALGPDLLLGEPVSLAEAATRVAFVIQVPNQVGLGPPDEVYVRAVAAGPMVSLLWQAQPELPEAAETGVGALLMEFQGNEASGSLIKRVAIGGEPEPVQIHEAHGFWISGASILVIAPDPSVGFIASEGRPSANVLIWQRDGITFRLETALPRDRALRLAESIGPPD